MKNNSYTKGDGIKAVTKLPDCLIKLIGWLDSRSSSDVAIAHLSKYYSILAKNEKDEALLAEDVLKSTREKGSKCIYTILHTDVDFVPESDSSDTSAIVKRAYARKLEEHNNKITTITKAKEALAEIDATIISGNLVFEERLEKTRNKGKSQIDVYVKGIRSGKLRNFNPEIAYDDLARTKYYDTHKENDDLIHQYAKETLS